MMKAAFAAWENRIAPVFDVARQVRIVETESGRITGEAEEALADDLPAQKARRLAELGVEALVCGAISRPMQVMVAAYGIRVIPFVTGDLREVIQAWLSGRLEDGLFAMPGCCGRKHRHFRGMPDQQGYVMKGKNRGRMGSRGGQGRGRGGQKLGRRGALSAAGSSGYSVWPRCGYREPHERGIPCTQKRCPKCGVAMTKE